MITRDELKRCSTDFGFFCERMLDESVADFQEELAYDFDTYPRSAIQIPRGHGKTRSVGVKYTLWKARFSPITYRHPMELLIISAAKHQSINTMSSIQSTLMSNEYFTDLVPSKNSKLKFNTDKLELTNGVVVHCRPYNRNVVSVHCDRIFMDEGSKVDDPSIFFRDITPIVGNKGGHIMVAGTIDREGDLLLQCMEKEDYYSKSLKACNKEFENILWEKAFPKKKLMDIYRFEGPASFAQNYLGEMISDTTRVFPQDLITHACDKNFGFYPTKPLNTLTFTGVDLAQSYKGDYIVLTTLALTPDNRLWIVDIRRSRGTDPEIIKDSLVEINHVYDTQEILIDESNLFGPKFVMELVQEKYLPAKGFSFQAQKRMEILNTLIRNFPRIIIPRSQETPDAVEQTNTLISELGGFIYGTTNTGLRTYESKAAHDDTVMSLALAVQASTNYQPYTDLLKQTQITTSGGKYVSTGLLDESDIFGTDSSDIFTSDTGKIDF
jgi:hypothetical protein